MTSSTSAATGRAGGSRRAAAALGLAAALVLSAGATACSGDGDAAGAPSEPARRGPVVTGFEAGLPDGTTSASVATLAGAAHGGRRGLEVRARGGEAFLSWDAAALGGDGPYWSFRAFVRVVDWTDGESVDLFTVRNGEVKNNFDLFVASPNRNLMWDLFRGDNVVATAPLVPGEWHLVEARGSFAGSTYTAEVRLDGVDEPGITSQGQVPSRVREFVLGSIGTAKTNAAQFDDVTVAVGDGPLPFLGPAPGVASGVVR